MLPLGEITKEPHQHVIATTGQPGLITLRGAVTRCSANSYAFWLLVYAVGFEPTNEGLLKRPSLHVCMPSTARPRIHQHVIATDSPFLPVKATHPVTRTIAMRLDARNTKTKRPYSMTRTCLHAALPELFTSNRLLYPYTPVFLTSQAIFRSNCKNISEPVEASFAVMISNTSRNRRSHTFS